MYFFFCTKEPLVVLACNLSVRSFANGQFAHIHVATWSDEMEFVTPVGIGEAVSIFAFGDLGQAPIDDTQEQVTNVYRITLSQSKEFVYFFLFLFRD
jgi:hypothetical protein